jgi:hypothetical protein
MPKENWIPTPTYISWTMMRQRCNNPRATGYQRYGGRGIKVCQRWDSFTNFLEDMGERPEGMTLDRKDNDGNYEPGNCRWATKSQQQTNCGRTPLSWVMTSTAARFLHRSAIRIRQYCVMELTGTPLGEGHFEFHIEELAEFELLDRKIDVTTCDKNHPLLLAWRLQRKRLLSRVRGSSSLPPKGESEPS